MSRMDFWRQLDIVDPGRLGRQPITVIGAGGIGSPTVLTLSKMGAPNITVYDGDSVEAHNLPNQMFRIKDVGKPKVQALSDIVWEYAGFKITPIQQYFTDQPVNGLVISAVDSMEGEHGRSAIWERMRYNATVPLYIDARMSAQVLRIHTISPSNPRDIRWYEKTLYSNGEEAPCTERAIIYTVQNIAGFIANQVKKFVEGESFPKEIIFDFVTMTADFK